MAGIHFSQPCDLEKGTVVTDSRVSSAVQLESWPGDIQAVQWVASCLLDLAPLLKASAQVI